MRQAEERERKTEDLPHASSHLLRIVQVALGNEREAAARVVGDEVGDERDPAVALEEKGVLRRPGARREDGGEAAGEDVPVAVALVRLLVDQPGERRRVDRCAQLAAVTPGRALVRAGRQADRGDLPEWRKRFRRERDGIDEHRAGLGGDGVPGAPRVDAVVRNEPVPDARSDLFDARSHGARLGHVRIIPSAPAPRLGPSWPSQ